MSATRRAPAAPAPTRAPTPTESVHDAYARIAAAGRPDVWTQLVDPASARAEASLVQARIAAGLAQPLAGLSVAVKDNIDVAGVPTSAGCPAFAYTPARDAPAVGRLRAAGAVVIGKTNLDQFATGLTGTRSPYGPVADARRPERIAGGSSSGSAVAVALGLTDLALGTDTAGSGRVPAALQGIVGFKPTRGRVPSAGVVPACRSFDCVSVMARGPALAETALGVIADPAPLDAPLAAPPQPTLAVFAEGDLGALSPGYRAAYAAVLQRLAGAGLARLRVVGAGPFLASGELLYGGALVAERYAAVGAFIETRPPGVDPTVAEIILAAREISAADYLADRERLRGLSAAAVRELAGTDALLLPTVPRHPTLAEVAADPHGVGVELGSLVSFANLLDMCAVSLPAGEAEGGHFGVTLYGRRHHDAVIADLARRLQSTMAGVGAEPAALAVAPPGAVELLVLGAHLRGQPLNCELTERGARFLGTARTAQGYRLYRLDTDPPKPGLVRSEPGSAGASIAAELWALPPAGLATLLARLPAPMALGPVQLADGRSVTGFLCEPAALSGAEDITGFHGWLEYLAAA